MQTLSPHVLQLHITVRKNLYSNGFGYVWEAQNVDSEALFLSKYLLRIKDQISTNMDRPM